MTGIIAAAAGAIQNVVYGAGLYRTASGVDLSPINFSASSSGGSSLSYDYTWLGYYRPAATGTVTLSLATSYIEYINVGGAYQYNWGGGGSTVARFWLGSNAVSNPTAGNANITSDNNTASYSPSLISGIYYPVRITMSMSLPYDQYAYYAGGALYYPGYATGSFNFQSNSSTNVTNLIWYNTKTNGF